MGLSVSSRNFFTNFSSLDAPASQSGIGLSNRFAEVEKIGDSSCYTSILAKYPGMDSASQSIVKILCANQLDALDVGEVALSTQGIHGIGEALQQNTKLRSFRIDLDCLSSDKDCLTTFANDMVSALKVNRRLESLYLRFGDGSEYVLASQVLFSNLPCFNLLSFTCVGLLTSTAAASIFPNIFSQKFPLTNFSWSDVYISPNMLWSAVSSLSQGIGNNTCIKNLDLSQNSLNATSITTLFGGIATSRIERFYLPQMLGGGNDIFSDEQKAAIIGAVRSDSCFLECVPGLTPLPADLAAAINNITNNRTACPPDPACSVPVSCPPSPTPPSPYALSLIEGIAIGIASTIGFVALTALGVYAARNCRAGSAESQTLI